MKKYFLKSNKGSVSLETALMMVIVFPSIYFMITFFGTAYIYTGKAIETTKGLADFITRWDSWSIENISGGDSGLPNAVIRYTESLGITDNSSILVPVYNANSFGYYITAAYISGGSYHICANLTNMVISGPGGAGIFPAPVLDAQTLSVEGPVWIVKSIFTVRGLQYSHTTVRRALGLSMTLIQSGTTYICSPTMTPITYQP
jgi:hypothetical protein